MKKRGIGNKLFILLTVVLFVFSFLSIMSIAYEEPEQEIIACGVGGGQGGACSSCTTCSGNRCEPTECLDNSFCSGTCNQCYKKEGEPKGVCVKSCGNYYTNAQGEEVVRRNPEECEEYYCKMRAVQDFNICLPLCESDDDCKDSWNEKDVVCNEAEGRCVKLNDPPNREGVGGECGSDSKCASGWCRKNGRCACNEDSDCDSLYQVCDELSGTCLDTCDNDCANFEFCSYQGTCIPKYEYIGDESCNHDEDCYATPGSICYNRDVCRKVLDEPCSVDAECYSGYCDGEKCTLECEEHTDCGNEEICQNNHCTQIPCTGIGTYEEEQHIKACGGAGACSSCTKCSGERCVIKNDNCENDNDCSGDCSICYKENYNDEEGECRASCGWERQVVNDEGHFETERDYNREDFPNNPCGVYACEENAEVRIKDEGDTRVTYDVCKPLCENDEDCESPLDGNKVVCNEAEGRCVKLESDTYGTGTPCGSDSQCDSGWCRKNGRCACNHNSECLNNEVCDELSGTCLDTCTSEDDCGNDENCDYLGRCIPVPRPQSDDIECGTQYGCKTGYSCIAHGDDAEKCIETCSKDEDCTTPGAICDENANFCKKVLEAPCSYDVECYSNYCYAGKCALEPGNDCPQGTQCNAEPGETGVCIATGAASAGTSVSGPVGGAYQIDQDQSYEPANADLLDVEICSVDEDCADGYICNEGQCYNANEIDLLVMELNALISSMENALNDFGAKEQGVACQEDNECQSGECEGFIWKRCT